MTGWLGSLRSDLRTPEELKDPARTRREVEVPARGPTYVLRRLACCVEKVNSAKLFAPNDLPNSRVIEVHQRSDISEGEPVLLGLGKDFAPRFPRSLAIALKLLLSHFDRFGGSFALGGGGWHSAGDYFAQAQAGFICRVLP